MLDNSVAARNQLAHYSISEVASLAGALCLIPQNLNSLATLETVGHCCVACLPQGSRRANRQRAKKLMQSVKRWTGLADDPAAYPATQGFIFYGGTYVFIAPSMETMFALRILGEISNPEFWAGSIVRRRICTLIKFCCEVTQRCAIAGDLPRNLAMPNSSSSFQIPATEQLWQLQKSVTYSTEEWNDLIEETLIDVDDASSLCTAALPSKVSDDCYHSNLFAEKPFIQHDDLTILAAPHRLAEAAVYKARTLIGSEGPSNQLVCEFHKRSLARVEDLLTYLGFKWMFSDWRHKTDSDSSQFSDCLIGWDKSKRRAYISVVSDGCLDESWNDEHISEQITNGNRFMTGFFQHCKPSVVEHFNLIVWIPLIERVKLSIPKDITPCPVCISAADLETLLDGAEAWERAGIFNRYVKARDFFERVGRILAFSDLDIIEFWRSRNFRFPRNVSFISCSSDLARQLRERALQKIDAHAVPDFGGCRLIEVEHAREFGLPIYFPRFRRGPILRVVELSNHYIWLMLNDQKGIVQRLSPYKVLQMVSFWIAQFSEYLQTLISSQAEQTLIEIYFQETSGNGGKESGYTFHHQQHNRLIVCFSCEFTNSYGPDNHHERQFAMDLIHEIQTLWDSVPSLDEFKRIFNSVAPLGPKRILHAFNAINVPEFLSRESLPEPLLIHPGDFDEIRLHAFVELLNGSSQQYEVEIAKNLINKGVERIYSKLMDSLSAFDSDQLLERLMLNNEALLVLLREEEIMLASQLACANDSEIIMEQLQNNSQLRTASAIATRFLLEIIVTCPKVGTEYVGMVDLQHLLAMASELIDLGTSSDIHNYELDKVCVKLDKDGFPTVEHGIYDEASRLAYATLFEERVQKEKRRTEVPRSLGSSRRELTPQVEAQLDSGMHAEYGITLDQFRNIINSLVYLGEEIGPIVALPIVELVNQLSEKTSLSANILRKFLSIISLQPREDFLKPPQPFHAADVYPWRYNRRLSILQRPIFQVNEKYYFSPGHVYRSGEYLMGLIMSGRLKAFSAGMQKAMGLLKRKIGDEFNDIVKELLEGLGYVCRTRVSKINGSRLTRDNKTDLGDIDVLAIDHDRQIIFAIECKNFEQDRTPHEVINDLEELFLGTAKRESAQDRHIKRVEWLSCHLEDLITDFHLNGFSWKVVSVLVTSRILRSSLLGHAKMNVISYSELKDKGSLLA